MFFVFAVKFKEFGTGLVYSIEGLFVLSDPWWSASISISKTGTLRRLIGFPAYTLRSDANIAKEKVVNLFLMKCGADKITRNEFGNFVE